MPVGGPAQAFYEVLVASLINPVVDSMQVLELKNFKMSEVEISSTSLEIGSKNSRHF